MSAENSEEDILYHTIIAWWEKRRLKYCLVLTLLFLLIFSIAYLFFGNERFFDFNSRFWDAFLPVFLYIIFFCNLCYTAGWVFEVLLTYWFKWNFKEIHRQILFIAGVIIAFLLFFYDKIYLHLFYD
jgi:hypothetical protein